MQKIWTHGVTAMMSLWCTAPVSYPHSDVYTPLAQAFKHAVYACTAQSQTQTVGPNQIFRNSISIFFFFLSKLKRRLLKFFECFSGTWEASQHHDGGQKILHTLRNLDVNHPCVLYCNMAINKMKCISFLLCFLTPRSTRKPVAYLSQSKAPLRLHPSNIIPI